jgi:HTH-type transcriptional regulator/antitoxin HigA
MTDRRTIMVEPPGSFIKMELEERGWSQRDLAFVLGQTEQQLSPLLSGKRAITPDMARLLGDAFGIEPEFFANLQSQFDLRNAKVPDPSVRARAELQSKYPIREMIKRGWIEDSDGSLLQLQVDRFFENDNGLAPVCFAAKRTHPDSTSSIQLAWVFRVRQLAHQMDVRPFSAETLRDAIPKLRSLMIHPEAVSEVPGILAKCGVRFVLVEVLPGAKIDGVCTWLNATSPVIGISTLYDRLDNFWFVLRHELQHALEGHGRDAAGIVDHLVGDAASTGSDVPEDERVANAAAADFCVPTEKMQSFYDRKYPYFSEKDVVSFAAVQGVHPAIVVGQLQRRLKRYDYLRKYQVPIRKYLAKSAVSDGWGCVVNSDL